MNTSQFKSIGLRAKWGTVPYREVQTRASRRKPPSITPRPSPRSRGQLNPSTQHLQQPDSKVYQGPTMSPRLMTFLGITVLGISSYCGFLYASYTREVSKAQALEVPTDVSDRYNKTASTFDAEVELSEKAMRMGKKRRDLIRLARGNVLEVSCGTGRNLEYYDISGERRGVDDQGRATTVGCRSLTFVDLSPQMVAITKQKFETMYPGYKNVTFRAQDAGSVSVELPPGVSASVTGAGDGVENENKIVAPGPYYDTVVQTMGLCSMPDPVGTLRHLGSVTDPRRGRILLLEHGRSHYDWLNRILDNLAPAHADRHGCWWNRDIGALVRATDLEIVEEKRWHFGTTWKYVLRPRQGSGLPQP